MVSSRNFGKDLLLGEAGEQKVIQHLESLGAVYLTNHKDYKYDSTMLYRGKRITYEIKTDVFCSPSKDTGNMFIEFESRGKPSGISVTEADWFVTYYYHLNQIWYIKTDVLRAMIAEKSYRTTQFSGDKGSNTKGYLIPRNTNRDKFLIFEIT